MRILTEENWKYSAKNIAEQLKEQNMKIENGEPVFTWDEKLLALATFISSWSKDPSTKVGAVISDEKHRVMGVGFNGFPRGVPDDSKMLNDREQKYPRVVHAELNAILNSSETKFCTLYCTLYPCSICAGPIIQAGITRIVSPPIEVARWSDSQKIAQEMFQQSEICIDQVQSLCPTVTH